MQPTTSSSNEHNLLVELIMQKFVQKFALNSKLLYIGNIDGKPSHFDAEGLQELGISLELCKDNPDIILYDKARNWLMLIDAATHHGPITEIRQAELKKMFARFDIGLVFITALLDYKGFQEKLDNVSWESDVWVAESPSHMVHFDGERFLGPF